MTNAVNLASAAGTGFAFRNRIINGGMAVDQRNAGASVSLLNSLAYSTIDRFFTNASSNSGQYSAQRITATDGTNRLRITSPAGGTGIALGQRIEALNSRDLAGSTVTLSLKLVSSVARDVTWTLSYANSSDVFTAVTQIATGTWSATTSEQTFSATVSIPSAATTGLQFQISSGTLSGGATLTTGDWQLEVGSVATPFERRPYGLEELLCKRYYQTVQLFPATSFANYTSYFGGSNAVSPPIPLPVSMRSAPTVSLSNPSVEYYSFAGAWTSTTLSASALGGSVIYAFCSSDGDGRGKLMRNGSSGTAANPVANLNAEL